MAWLGRSAGGARDALLAWLSEQRIRWETFRRIDAELRSTRIEIRRLADEEAELRRVHALKGRNFPAELGEIKARLEIAYERLNNAAESARAAGKSAGRAAGRVRSWHWKDDLFNGGKTPQSSWIWPDAQDLHRAKGRRDATHSAYARAKGNRDAIWESEVQPLKDQRAAILRDREEARATRHTDHSAAIAELAGRIAALRTRGEELRQQRFSAWSGPT